MPEKQSFVRRIEKELQDQKIDILQFRAIAELAELDEQIEYYQIIEGIVAKEKALKEKLSVFEGMEDWISLKEEIEGLQQRLRDAIATARATIT